MDATVDPPFPGWIPVGDADTQALRLHLDQKKAEVVTLPLYVSNEKASLVSNRIILGADGSATVTNKIELQGPAAPLTRPSRRVSPGSGEEGAGGVL